jgi:hypothetical protein
MRSKISVQSTEPNDWAESFGRTKSQLWDEGPPQQISTRGSDAAVAAPICPQCGQTIRVSMSVTTAAAAAAARGQALRSSSGSLPMLAAMRRTSSLSAALWLCHLEPFGAPSIFAHGSLAMFTAMRRASSWVRSFAAARRPGSSRLRTQGRARARNPRGARMPPRAGSRSPPPSRRVRPATPRSWP